jgi:hypothetical protein
VISIIWTGLCWRRENDVRMLERMVHPLSLQRKPQQISRRPVRGRPEVMARKEKVAGVGSPD